MRWPPCGSVGSVWMREEGVRRGRGGCPTGGRPTGARLSPVVPVAPRDGIGILVTALNPRPPPRTATRGGRLGDPGGGRGSCILVRGSRGRAQDPRGASGCRAWGSRTREEKERGEGVPLGPGRQTRCATRLSLPAPPAGRDLRVLATALKPAWTELVTPAWVPRRFGALLPEPALGPRGPGRSWGLVVRGGPGAAGSRAGSSPGEGEEGERRWCVGGRCGGERSPLPSLPHEGRGGERGSGDVV